MKELLSSLILMGMGAYGIILYSANKLSLYIHPRFFEESLVASVVALIVGGICFSYYVLNNKSKINDLKNLFNKKLVIITVLVLLSFYINTLFLLIAAFIIFAPNKEFDKYFKNDFFINVLIICIVLIGIFLPSKGLSSITASQRSIDLNSINLTQNTITAVQNFNKSTASYSLGDWIAMQRFNPDPLFYKGKDVKISGFVYRPDSLHLDSNTALVARFIITCCAVDARPVGLKVILPVDSNYKADDWIEVVGKFDIDSNNEVTIKADTITKIDQPTNPYIF